MKYEVTNIIEGPIATVVEITRDRSRDVKVYPNITETIVIKSEEDGTKVHEIVKSVGNGDIPPALRKILTPDLLAWIEDGTYDYATNYYTYTIKHAKFAAVFTMTGSVQFTALSDTRTQRVLKGDIRVNIPIVGSIAEKKIVEIQKENLDLESKILQKDVAEKLAQQK